MNNVTSINLTNDNSVSDSASLGSITNDTNNGNSATAATAAYSGYTTSYTAAVAATSSVTAYSGYTTSYTAAVAASSSVTAYDGYTTTPTYTNAITVTTSSSATEVVAGTTGYYHVVLSGYGKASDDNTGNFTSLSSKYIGIAGVSSFAGVASMGYCFTSEAAANAFGEALKTKVNADKTSTSPTEGNYWINPRPDNLATFYYISSYSVSSSYGSGSTTAYGNFYSATSYSFSGGGTVSGATGSLGSSTSIAGGGTYYLAQYYKSGATSTTTSTTYKFTTSAAALQYAYYLSYNAGWTTAKGSYSSATNGSAAVAAKVTGSLGSSTTVAGGGTYYTANYYASSSATSVTANTTYKFTTAASALQYAYYLSYNAGCTTAKGSTTESTNGNAYKAPVLSGTLGSATTVAGGGTYYTANYYASSSATTTTANTSYKFTTAASALQYAYYLSYNAGCTSAKGSTSSATNGVAANTSFSTFQHDRKKIQK